MGTEKAETDDHRGPDRLTTKAYWAERYSTVRLAPVDPLGRGSENHVAQAFDRRMAPFLTELAGRRLLEVGCGGSRWLPYLFHRYKLSVSGLDFTESGCEAAEQVLRHNDAPGSIIHADLFSPPADLLGSFDVVLSMGVVEHFADTASAVRACAAFCRPGAVVITVVPTLKGLYGVAYRTVRPYVYALHRPLSANDLADAHSSAGLDVVDAEYVLGLPLPIEDPRVRTRTTLAARASHIISRPYWYLEAKGFGVPANRWTSPYAICIARASCGVATSHP
jgi:2-polyprenyl-3-methyl-5-hydroxy-6-metoxy-1,4-benzoquinol methylase